MGEQWKKRKLRVLKRFDPKSLDDAAREVVEKLQSLGESDVQDLITQLKQGPLEIKIQAAITLGHLGAQAKTAVPALIDELKAKNKTLKDAVIWALWEMRSASVPQLIEAARSIGKRRNFEHILDALAGPDLNPDVAFLAKALEDEDENVQTCAGQAFGYLAYRGVKMVPALLSGMSRDRGWTGAGMWLCAALGQLGPSVLPYMYDALHDEGARTRWSAIGAIGIVMAVDLSAIEDLNALTLQEPKEWVQKSAVNQIEFIATQSGQMLGGFVATLSKLADESSDPARQIQCRLALQNIRLTLPGSVFSSNLNSFKTRPDRRKRKRSATEREKHLLALLETCVEWPDKPFSKIELMRSDLYRAKRRSFRLPEQISETAIFNYMKYLAELCGLKALASENPKRGRVKLNPVTLERLPMVRPILEASINNKNKDEEEANLRRRSTKELTNVPKI
jgi:HEAT repeat protein